MWLLEFRPLDAGDDDDVITCKPAWLRPAMKFTLARKASDDLENPIVVPVGNVSKVHGFLTIGPAVLNEATNRIKKPEVKYTDKSRNGTYLVKGTTFTRVQGETNLMEDDVLSLGVEGPGDADLRWRPMVIAISGFKKSAKAKLKQTCQELGISLEDANVVPTDASYLMVQDKITVTAKVIAALLLNIPIITEHWLRALQMAKPTEFVLPDPFDFLPPINEDAATREIPPESLKPNPARQRLFAGRTFIVMNEGQLERIQNIAERGGARITTVDISPTIADDVYREWSKDKKNTVILFPSNAWDEDLGYETEAQMETIVERTKTRLVNETELAWAVVDCSTDEYCNPFLSFDPMRKHDRTDAGSVASTAMTNRTGQRYIPTQAAGSVGTVGSRLRNVVAGNGAGSEGSERGSQQQQAGPANAGNKILVPATQSQQAAPAPVAPLLTVGGRVKPKVAKASDVLDSIMDSIDFSVPIMAAGSGSQAGSGSAGTGAGSADQLSKRKLSQEEASQGARKRTRINPLDLLDFNDDDAVVVEVKPKPAEASKPPVAPTQGKKVVKPARPIGDDSDVEPAPTANTHKQFSQSTRKIEDAPMMDVEEDAAPAWKEAPRDMYEARVPKRGEPGYAYLMDDEDPNEEKVAFDDPNDTKKKKADKKGIAAPAPKAAKLLRPEAVHKMAQDAAKARKERDGEDEGIMEISDGMKNLTKVVFGAQVIAPKSPVKRGAAKASKKGKEKENDGKPNFKKFKKGFYPGRDDKVIRPIVVCTSFDKDEDFPERVWITEQQDPQLRKPGHGGGPQTLQYKSLKEFQAEPEDRTETVAFDDLVPGKKSKVITTKSAAAEFFGRTSANNGGPSSVKPKAGARVVDSDDDDSMFNYVAPSKPKGRSSKIAIEISDEEEDDSSKRKHKFSMK